MEKLKQWVKQADNAFEKIGQDVKALKGGKTSIPTLQEVTKKGNITTEEVTIYNNLNLKNSSNMYPNAYASAYGFFVQSSTSNSCLANDTLKLGANNDDPSDFGFFVDTSSPFVSGKPEVATAFNNWLNSLKQEKFGRNSFDWQFHPDLYINGFSVLKTGKQVMITAFLSINATTETSSITLFKIPDELKGDPNIQFVNQLIYVPRFGRPMSPHFTVRKLEYLCHEGNVIVSNSPMNGIYDDFTDFNNCEFRISLTYSME